VSYSLERPKPGPPPVEMYDPALDRPVPAAYFLLDPHPEDSAEAFIQHTLGRLVQQLSRSTQRHESEYRGRVRGRIVWPATYKSRLVQGGDPSMYVCREVRSRYDTAENQLLKYMVLAFNDCLRILPEIIRGGMCYRPAGRDGTTLPSNRRLNQIENTLRSVMRNARLQEINLPPEIGEFHLLRAEAASLPEYAQLAALYRRYQKLILKPSWYSLVHTPSNFILLPDRPGRGGDSWIRLGARLLQARLLEEI
jgi:hypothetical protein